MSDSNSIIYGSRNIEVWGDGPPKMGDHIRVKRVWGIYAHHGIYVSDDEVIHFTGQEDDSILDWSKAEVIVSDIETFLRGGELEVREYTRDEEYDLYPVDEIVSYARSCIGERGYDLVRNNCEHFANRCTLGKHRSKQVNDFVYGKNKEDKNMGILSGLGDFCGDLWNAAKGAVAGAVSGFFGEGSSKSDSSSPRGRTIYEPDKVKIAEIEADTQIHLANMERDRIELVKQARIDILQFETQSQIDIEKARVEGNLLLMNALIEMQEKINDIAQRRLEILMSCSAKDLQDLEHFYADTLKMIREDDFDYRVNKLPKLIELRDKYEPDSSSFKIYDQSIKDDMENQKLFFNKQTTAVIERQNMVTKNYLESKDKILLQSSEITAGFIETAKEYAKQLAINTVQAIPMNETKAIDTQLK